MKAKQLPLSTRKIQHDEDPAGNKIRLTYSELGKSEKSEHPVSD